MDSDRVGELVRNFMPKLLQVARRKLNDPELAEDAVDEVFTRILEKPSDAMDSPRRFLIRAVIHACLDRNKTEKRETARRKKYRIFQAPPELEEMREELERQIALLPKEQRDVFEWKTDKGLTIEEVAELLEISVSTAESRFRHARETLKSRMMKPEETEK